MYQGYKVKVFIFAGREQTMRLLMPQIKSDYIDEVTYKSIDKTCSTIRILLIASIKTAKSKLNR